MGNKKKTVRITSQTHFSSQTITPFGAVKFDERGVSEPIPFEAAEFLLQFPNYSEYEEAAFVPETEVKEQPQEEEQDEKELPKEEEPGLKEQPQEEKATDPTAVKGPEDKPQKSGSGSSSRRRKKPENEGV